jgi:hypothetical protein
MSTHHDEHGRPEAVEREYGPEWWAMGAELCACGHRVDDHDLLTDGPSACQDCDCADLNLDNH